MKCPSCQKEITNNSSFCGHCGEVLYSRKDIWNIQTQTLPFSLEDVKRGSTFSRRYEIIEELGEGGLGRAFRAFDSVMAQEVTLEILNPEISKNWETNEGLQTEIKSAGKIDHENVCKIYDFGQKFELFFITMEYIPGQDLKSLIRQTGHLALPAAVGLAKQVCRGLMAAHQAGVIHCHLKSASLKIDREGQIRIMDFGLAWVLSDDPEYMSEEQARGEKVDSRTDIYSLGVVLYEMVTGRVPLRQDSTSGAASKNRAKEPQVPSGINPMVSKELDRVIFKCLEKDREKRYESVHDLYIDLEKIDREYQDSQATSSGQDTPKSFPASKPSRLFRIFFGVLLMVFMTTVLSLLLLKNKDQNVSGKGMLMLVVLPFENLGPPEDDYFSDGLSEEIMSRLAALKDLGVISRNSAFHYKKTERTIKKIGEELGVDFVLEGSVRWNREPEGKGRVRVTAQLIRVDDDTHLWAESYDRMIEDIFSVQAEIADQVTKRLDIAILEPERSALRENPTENIEAYDAYLRARTAAFEAYLGQNRQGYERAIELLNEVVRLDPNFLQAHLSLFEYQLHLYTVGLDRTEERLSRIREALQQILELAPDSPEVQMSQGSYFQGILQDYDRALEIYDSVQRIRPNLSPSYLANIQMRQGKWKECIANFERAFKMNPLSSILAHVLGRCYAWINDYERSEEWFNRALSILPDLFYSKLGKARLPLLADGNTQEARLLMEMLPQHVLTDYNLFELGLLEHKYEEVLERLRNSPYDTMAEAQFYIPKDLAYSAVYHALGNLELMRFHAAEAVSGLERKTKEHPEDIRLYAALGLAYAFAGRNAEAVREGQRAVSLYPVSRDAFEGPRYVLNLAKIYAVIGDAPRALDQLEYMFSIPCGNNYSIPILKLDPVWNSLRGHMRFQRLLARQVLWRQY